MINTLNQLLKPLATLYFVGLILPAVIEVAQAQQQLNVHVPAAVSALKPKANLDDAAPIDLIIGLPLRSPDEARNLLQGLYDPASPVFHKYLSPQDYVTKFCPTEASYAALLNFAKANNLSVITAPANRKFVHVRAAASTIDKVFHVTLRQYQHPTENRLFYAADGTPSIDLQVPVSYVSGLDNFEMPKRAGDALGEATRITHTVAPAAGSGRGGLYTGGDFRAAYAPGVSLTGRGQNVGILEFSGYNPSDISTYEASNGIPNVPIQNVYLDGYTGSTQSASAVQILESSADIELVVSMAPGIAKAIVYGAPYSNAGVHDVLNEMANPSHGEPLPYQITTSYMFFYDQNVDDTLTQLALQGQAFFVASGDGGAYNETTGAGAHPPADYPYITSVGGTVLQTSGPGGKLTSESAVFFSGGGYSPWAGTDSHFAIPAYQFGMNLALANGSNFARNVPDVAMVATGIGVFANGTWQSFAGTSGSTPLWAGFMALANEQAANLGVPHVGFANPALYAAGRGGSCTGCFNDITVGDNAGANNATGYQAVRGYDLVTGWGSPKGGSLIDALVSYGSSVTGTVWRYTGTPCSSGCPGWNMLDDNSAIVGIAASLGNLYELHQRFELGSGAATIWKFNGTACQGTTCSGWIELDDNPAAVAIVADGAELYQLHNNGQIWKSTGIACNGASCPGWQMLDDNPAAVAMAASGGNLYQLHSDGSAWKYTGQPCNGSECFGWEMLDNNPATKAIVADGGNFYELHDTGSIWRWTGAPCDGSECFGWQMYDNNVEAIGIAAAGGNLYELRSNGALLKSTGKACSATCTAWETIGSTAGTTSIVAQAANLYRLREPGIVEKWNGTPHSWTELDNNPLTTQIVAGGGNLYQLHGRH